jgi:hypothetical protein
MSPEKTREDTIPIACNPEAVPAEKREQWMTTGKQVYAAVQYVKELPDGYGFCLPAEMLRHVVEYISNERLCCGFLRFTVEVEPNAGPLWLRLTGGDGVKEYMQSVFQMHDLLSESVARATGLWGHKQGEYTE